MTQSIASTTISATSALEPASRSTLPRLTRPSASSRASSTPHSRPALESNRLNLLARVVTLEKQLGLQPATLESFAPIFCTVAQVFGVTVSAILEYGRMQPLADARHVVVGLILETGWVNQQRLSYLLDRDHVSILRSRQRFENLCETDPIFRAKVERARELLRAQEGPLS